MTCCNKNKECCMASHNEGGGGGEVKAHEGHDEHKAHEGHDEHKAHEGHDEHKAHEGEVHSLSADQVDALKVSAQNFGVDNETVAGWLSDFGPTVLSLAVEALRAGFSLEWVKDTLVKLGPNVMEFIISLFHKKTMLAAQGTADTLPGEFVHDGVKVDSSIFMIFIEQMVPIIFERFGPTILKAIEQAIMDAVRQRAFADHK